MEFSIAQLFTSDKTDERKVVLFCIFFRSSWEEDSHFTYLKCGPLGSGHGHADLTHISLYYRGRPVLADSGRYSYVEEEPLRPFLKSAQAHNVCVNPMEGPGVHGGMTALDRALKIITGNRGRSITGKWLITDVLCPANIIWSSAR